MKIAMSKTREQFPLSTKKVLKKTVTNSLAWVVLFLIVYGAIAAVLLAVGGKVTLFILATLAVIVLLFIIILLVYLYQKWYYAVYFYDLTADYIIIRKNPITPREITIPYERVQDVYVDQDLWDRFFGLYDVHLSSATISSGMAAHIDGVERAAADGLRAVLLKTVQEKISRKTNQTNK